MALAAGTRLGLYEIQSLLGAGGMGEVYKARDSRLNRSIAIKILAEGTASDPERRARFEREAQSIPNSELEFSNNNNTMVQVTKSADGKTMGRRTYTRLE
jgi:serine/threonine protein kinase